MPSTIFCGFTDAFDSFREEEREQQVSQPSTRRAEERDPDDSSIALDECYDNSDDSTVVSNSGASVLSIDYDGAEEVVKEGDKADSKSNAIAVNAGHWLYVQKADECFEHIRKFMQT